MPIWYKVRYLQRIAKSFKPSTKPILKAVSNLKRLNWRTNNPNAKRKSLGWLPFKQSAIKHIATQQTGKKGLKSTMKLNLDKGQRLIMNYGTMIIFAYTKSRHYKSSRPAITIGMLVLPLKSTQNKNVVLAVLADI